MSQDLENVTPTSGFRTAMAVARDRGISTTTLWRWARRGWIRTVNIAGRPYVCLDSLKEFDRRAAAGEFAKPPHGCAKRSADFRNGEIALAD
jgi:hypothetical protein